MRDWTASQPAPGARFDKQSTEVSPMAKRGRKKRDRKHSKANHGKRPNS